MNKIYVFALLFIHSFWVYPGGGISKASKPSEYDEKAGEDTPPVAVSVSSAPDVSHTLPYCRQMERVFSRGNFTENKLRTLLKCECCRKRAFTSLVNYISKFGYAKSKAIADLFMQNGISVNDPDDIGNLPIVDAATYQDIDAVNFFISLGADVNKKGRFETAALREVVYSGALDENEVDKQNTLKVVEALLEAGANPNITDEDNYTLLMQAGRHKSSVNSNIVYLLLMYGADPNIRDKSGKTFFDYAKYNPEALEAYERYKGYITEKRRITYETLSKKAGLNEDMPDVLVDMINEY